MQLKRLEAHGFKSFADRIAIDFDAGVTAIVGPNGSGKSNITDAIRWVLGEQNVRNLRGLRAEDIIFTGSASRKALNVAEVTLFFEHNGELPLEFKEVSVKRRLFRSGESEFFINNTRCRLKDVYNLFADTGIGHDGMSIIGQNRIDEILGAKPEERRVFFEETAGITKYKSRKRESMAKLKDSENNLIRVNDLLQELERGLEPLSRQASKTRRHEELSTEEKRCHITFLWQRHEELQTDQRENSDKLSLVQDDETATLTEVKTMQAEQEVLGKEILDLEEQLRRKAQQNETIHNRIEAANVEMATLKERRENHDSIKERLEREREELKKLLEIDDSELVNLAKTVKEQAENLALVDELLAEERKKSAEYAADIRRAKEEAERLNREFRAAGEKLVSAEKELAAQDRAIETMFGGEDEQKARLTSAKNDVEMRRAEQDKRQRDLAQLENHINALSQDIAVQRKQEQALRQIEAQKVAYLSELSHRIRDDETRLEMLAKMQQSYEGFGRAVKAVLQSEASWHAGVAGAVAELIKVDAKYITAIEIALGGNLQNIVTDDTTTAKAAIEFLKREHLGRATFLPLSDIQVKSPDNVTVLNEPGCLGYANTLVKVSNKYAKAIDFLLGRTVVAENTDYALTMAKKNNYRLRIVTLTGELLTAGGAISGGSRSPKETGYLNRRDEIERIQERLTAAKAEEAAALTEQKCLAAERDSLTDRIETLLEEKQKSDIGQAELKAVITGGTAEVQAAENFLTELLNQAEKRRESFAAAQNKRTDIAKLVAEQKKTMEEARKSSRNAEINLDELTLDADDLTKYINDRELKRAVLEQKLQYSRQNLSSRQREREQRQENLQKNLAEEATLEEDFARTASRLTELQAVGERETAAYEAGQKEHRQIYDERLEKMAERDLKEKTAKELGKKLAILQEQKHKLELVASKLEFSLDECREKLLSDYGLTPVRAAEYALDISSEELKPKLKKLQEDLAALGAVNPHAVEEYAALEKRCGEMRRQVDDIGKAKNDLLSIIADMDVTMTKQFSEAFAKIQEYFGDIFVRLFGGGKAELRLLDENDILNTGVEILVELPQKKRQNLSALSGGERALTVVALLFSFLRYRPSPFSVLDEIDAPLDEANVARFGQFLREFAQNTQFIVVTHRKGTMESVDTMYGVTIEDAGVSKILSVKIEN